MPKKTIDIILSTQNHYLIEIKGNQKTLLEGVKKIIAENEPLDSCSTQEKNRGRQENRYHEIYNVTPDIPTGWNGVQRVIFVHRYGHRPDKKTNEGNYSEKHYYIAGYKFNSARNVAKGIRRHWGIEMVHYVKDTLFNEDNNGIRHNNAAAILSIFQDIAINIYRCLGIHSLKTATIYFANKVKEHFKFLTAKHISNL